MPKKKGGGKKKEESVGLFGGLFGGGSSKVEEESPVSEVPPPEASDVEPQEVFSTPAQQPEARPAAAEPTPGDKGGEQLNFSTPASTPAKQAEEAPPKEAPAQQPPKQSPSKAEKQQEQAPEPGGGVSVKSTHFKPRGGGSGSACCNVCGSSNEIVIVASQNLKSGAFVPGSCLCQACINKQPTSKDWKEWIAWMDSRKSAAGNAA
uniref:Uncharacterized protein n=1 Tax=Hemiselmis tepida TaxID=464990 RepID=A0A7S0V7S4_9CRYP